MPSSSDAWTDGAVRCEISSVPCKNYTQSASVVSLTEALDMTTPGGRALAGMLAVFAEFERDILRDRVKAGIAQARKEGRPHGRPATVTRHAQEISSLFASGTSKRQIASKPGISRSSVRRMLVARRDRPRKIA